MAAVCFQSPSHPSQVLVLLRSHLYITAAVSVSEIFTSDVIHEAEGVLRRRITPILPAPVQPPS